MTDRGNMRQRGRRSAAALAIAGFGGLPRPEPPAELTAEQAEHWRAVVAAVPPDYFPVTTWPLLVQLCRHVTSARYVEGLLDEWRRGPRKDRAGLARLLAEQRASSDCILRLMRAMRLAHQSREGAGHKKPETETALRPWAKAA